MKLAKLSVTLLAACVLSVTMSACKQRSSAEQAAQIAGDVLNSDGRHREAEVAKEASAAAHAAAATAQKANELAQANLDAAVKAKAEAEQAGARAKAEVEQAAARAKAEIERAADSRKVPERGGTPASTPR